MTLVGVASDVFVDDTDLFEAFSGRNNYRVHRDQITVLVSLTVSISVRMRNIFMYFDSLDLCHILLIKARSRDSLSS